MVINVIIDFFYDVTVKLGVSSLQGHGRRLSISQVNSIVFSRGQFCSVMVLKAFCSVSVKPHLASTMNQTQEQMLRITGLKAVIKNDERAQGEF